MWIIYVAWKNGSWVQSNAIQFGRIVHEECKRQGEPVTIELKEISGESSQFKNCNCYDIVSDEEGSD